MAEKKRDFFISYNKADKQWAKWIAAVLENTPKPNTDENAEETKYTCYLQAWDFRPGGNFVLYMQNALVNSERFIAVLSKDYLKSLYCQAEWAAAFTKDPTGEKRLFIPVRISDIEPEGLFAAPIYIDLYGKDEAAAEKALIQGVDTAAIPRNRPPFPVSKRVRFPGSMPMHNLPYGKNEFFTGRDAVLEKISKGFDSGKTIALTQTISGLGGLGKTQTALEYAYRYSHKYDFIWWISAESEATVLTAYRDFAEKMQLLPNAQTDNDYITETVLNWMDQHDKWLFVYDNIESAPRGESWWPKTYNGNILITTRSALHIGEDVDIHVFTPEEARAFLEIRTDISVDVENAEKLAERLGHLPLALEQAAAYIRNNAVTYGDYLDLLDKYGLKPLEETKGVVDYKVPVTAAFDISINKIGMEDARQLLNLCAYLAPENIDRGIFSENTELLPSLLQEALSNKLDENKVWSALTEYSLLEVQDNKQYAMHRLLQEVVREKLKGELQWCECCLGIFEASFEFKYGNAESHKRFSQRVPHVESLLKNTEAVLQEDEQQTAIAELYNTGGYGYRYLGDYPQALEWHQKALAIRERVLGKEHPSTAATYGSIAGVYDSQGDYQRALEWNKMALKINEKVLGIEHPSTATIYNNIAGVYKNLGEHPKALEWYEKALEINEKVLGKEHPFTAIPYNNIGNVYDSLGDYPRALEWYEKALEISEKVLCIEHPNTATTYSNIAIVYNNLGDYTQALRWNQKAFEIFEKFYGKQHPSIATTCNNIGMVHDNLGDYPRALEWFRKALDICEKVYGIEHPHTGATYNNIAMVYNNQGDYMQALEWYEKALAIFERVLGIEHPDTAAAYNNIGEVYSSQVNYPRALEWFQKALNINEKVHGIKHPHTAATYNNIALVYNNQGDYPRALEWFQKAWVIRERVLGIEHPDTATTYNNIAGVYDRQGDYPRALEWYEKALEIDEKVLGIGHPDTATIYNNIAGVYRSQGDYQSALEWHEKTLEIYEKVLGVEHPSTATIYNNIAGVYDSQGDYQSALEWHEKALAIREKVLGVEHPDTAVTYNNIAGVYDGAGDYPRALEWNLKALAIREKVLGKDHPDTAATYNNIAAVYANQGDYPRALELFQRALPIYEYKLGSDHPLTMNVKDNIKVIEKRQPPEKMQ